jgi:hypothetical protein
MEQTNQESCNARPVVESDPKSLQELREILEDTLKSAPSKNASGGIKPGKVIASSVVDTAAHLKGDKHGKGIAPHFPESNCVDEG